MDLDGQTAGEVVSPRGDPHQDQPAGALVALEDLVGDAGQGPLDLAPVQKPSPLDEGGHGSETGRRLGVESGRRRPGEQTTPRARRGASWCCSFTALLPGLTGPDLKGKCSPRGYRLPQRCQRRTRPRLAD